MKSLRKITVRSKMMRALLLRLMNVHSCSAKDKHFINVGQVKKTLIQR